MLYQCIIILLFLNLFLCDLISNYKIEFEKLATACNSTRKYQPIYKNESHPHFINMPIFVIANDDQKKTFLNIWENFSEFIFSSPVYVNDYNYLKDFPKKSRDLHAKKHKRPLFKKDFSCAIAHAEVIKNAFLKNYSTIVVLEYDMYPYKYPFWHDTFESFVLNLPADWNRVLLERKCYHTGLKPYKKGLSKILGYGSGAYLINRVGMKIILDRAGYNFLDNTFSFKKLIKNCPSLTSDDCLLQFTPWKIIPGIYSAYPSLFFEGYKNKNAIHYSANITCDPFTLDIL